MLDYYSNFPPPSRPEAIKEVVKECTIKISLKKLSVSDTLLNDTATQIVNEMPSLGSYTGWYVSFKNDAIKMVMDKLTDCKSVE
jgi:hypothetical protein